MCQGADQDAAFANVFAQIGFLLRAHVKKIQDNGLTIEHEMFELAVLFKDGEHPIDQMDKLQTEQLKWELQLTIPVGVRNHE